MMENANDITFDKDKAGLDIAEKRRKKHTILLFCTNLADQYFFR